MSVAKLFSAKLGNELNFSKLDEKQKPAQNAQQSAMTAGEAAAANTHDATATSHHDDDSDSDSSEFSDLEPLQLLDESSRGPPQTGGAVYLRTCLECKLII